MSYVQWRSTIPGAVRPDRVGPCDNCRKSELIAEVSRVGLRRPWHTTGPTVPGMMGRLSLLPNSLNRYPKPMSGAAHARSSSRIFPRLSRAGASPQRLPGRWPWLILTVGFAVAGGVFFLVYRYEREGKRRAFAEAARHHVEVVETNFNFPLEVFRSLPPFFESSQKVERGEFQTFVEGALVRHPAIESFQWIPRVGRAGRAEVERQAHEDGLAGFEIREFDEGRRVVSAGSRSEYWPILYAEPQGLTLGLDLSTDPVRRADIERSIQHRDVVTSDRIRLAELDGDALAVVFYHPIFAASDEGPTAEDWRGVTAVILRIQPIMRRAFAG